MCFCPKLPSPTSRIPMAAPVAAWACAALASVVAPPPPAACSAGFAAAEVGKLLLTGSGTIIIGSNFNTKILPTLSELERLLGADARTVIAVVVRAASLITVNPPKLRSNFQFLLGQGLSEEEARALVCEAPLVFACTLDAANMGDKLRYYEEVLGISPRDMLVHQRGYLGHGLAKVDLWVRHCLLIAKMCMEKGFQTIQMVHIDGCLTGTTVYP